MTKRILSCADHPVRLRVELDQLIAESAGEIQRVPLEDLGVLIIGHPQASLSAAVLQRSAEAGAAVLVCDEKHLPVSLMLPMQGHFLQSERFRIQAMAGEPLKKRLWQQIIKAKLKAQGALLKHLYGADEGLAIMASKVNSGDTGNLEAQGARRYWIRLFNDIGFTRDRESVDQNRLLNYGYSVLRATVARSLTASGLHPGLGLHHQNRYSGLPLADDVMEPFRPRVDAVVQRIVVQRQGTDLTPSTRQALLGVLHQRVVLADEQRTVEDAILRSCQSLAACIEGGGRNVVLPDPWP